LLNSLDLGFVQRLLESCYGRSGAGRPPRNPLGLFKAHLAKRFFRINSLRELERRLSIDERLRAICGIAREEPAYGRTVLSRFNQRLGARRLRCIADKQVKKLISHRIVKARTIALDATFIKAYSRRNMNNRTGFSDPESRVGRAYRTYGLGYKLHMAADTGSGAPLSFQVAPANTNEKKLSTALLKRTVKITGASIRQLTADSQYSSSELRETAERYRIETAIPYPANQKPGKRNILRVTSDFKTHGPQRLKRIYRKRSIIELVFAWLKEHLNLNNHKVRGLERITIHISYCILCLLYTIEASHILNQAAKSLSITYWAN
jgi:transposase